MKFKGTVKLTIEDYEFLKEKAETINAFEQQLMRFVPTKRIFEITTKNLNSGTELVVLKDGMKTQEIADLVLSTFYKKITVFENHDDAKSAIEKQHDDFWGE